MGENLHDLVLRLANNGVARCKMTETVAECRLFDPAQFYPRDLWQCSMSLSAPNKVEERA